MIERLREIEARYDELATEMASPGLDVARLTELGRELARLEPVVNAIRAWDEVQVSLVSTRELADDPDEEVRAMARDELATLESRAAELEAELHVLLVPRDPNDERNVILEVRAGTGGDEAALFAADLYRMYARYATAGAGGSSCSRPRRAPAAASRRRSPRSGAPAPIPA